MALMETHSELLQTHRVARTVYFYLQEEQVSKRHCEAPCGLLTFAALRRKIADVIVWLYTAYLSFPDKEKERDVEFRRCREAVWPTAMFIYHIDSVAA